MLKDITFGQYFPGNSPVHRLDPRTKLVLSTVFIVMLFLANNAWGLGLGFLYAIVLYPLAKIPLKMILRSLKPILPIVLFSAILNMFFLDGEILWQFYFIKVTDRGLEMAIFIAVRIVCLIAGTSLLTYTTSPIALTDAIEQLFGPLKKVGAPVHEIAMMMTISLRFIPTLIEETDKIMSAQKARGADMESGTLIQRVKALIPILIPLFISAFRRAEDLALAMECRCYHGGEGRTRMRQLHYSGIDIVAGVITILCFAGVLASRFCLLRL